MTTNDTDVAGRPPNAEPASLRLLLGCGEPLLGLTGLALLHRMPSGYGPSAAPIQQPARLLEPQLQHARR